jgi:signal recognition particle receptor subunit beta
VAANKQDLFTALPPGSVRDKLESEIEKTRTTRSKGLLDPSVGTGGDKDDDEEEVLGGSGSQGKFSFKALREEFGVKVDVIGGAVKDDADSEVGSGVRKWEEWIGSCL